MTRRNLAAVLTRTTATESGNWEVSYQDRTGSARKIQWLTVADAIERRKALASRGYAAAIQQMAHVAEGTMPVADAAAITIPSFL